MGIACLSMNALRAGIIVVALLLLGGLCTTAAPAANDWQDCGSKRGGFPIYGAPGLTGTVHVNARRVRCEKALRFGHALFFGQECVYCDDPSNYSYGDRFKFRGFRCEVYRGEPQRFHCVRGHRVINVRTDIDQI